MLLPPPPPPLLLLPALLLLLLPPPLIPAPLCDCSTKRIFDEQEPLFSIKCHKYTYTTALWFRISNRCA